MAPIPKFGPIGPSINSWNWASVISSFASQIQYVGPSWVTGMNAWLKKPSFRHSWWYFSSEAWSGICSPNVCHHFPAIPGLKWWCTWKNWEAMFYSLARGHWKYARWCFDKLSWNKIKCHFSWDYFQSISWVNSDGKPLVSERFSPIVQGWRPLANWPRRWSWIVIQSSKWTNTGRNEGERLVILADFMSSIMLKNKQILRFANLPLSWHPRILLPSHPVMRRCCFEANPILSPMFTLYNTEHWCRAIRKSATK